MASGFYGDHHGNSHEQQPVVATQIQGVADLHRLILRKLSLYSDDRGHQHVHVYAQTRNCAHI